MTAPLFYKECQFFTHFKYYPYLCLKIIDIKPMVLLVNPKLLFIS